jgi:5,10-methylenetetrahydromethanopterin reductase
VTSGALKLSLIYYPDDPIDEALAIIRRAEELGFYACYLTDFPYRKDPWIVMAAAARETSRIRLGPSVARVLFRDPVLTAQAVATLDELSGGRADPLIGIGGNLGQLAQSLAESPVRVRPLARLREAHEVMRLFLSQDSLEFSGEFYDYRYTDLPLSAKPVQAHVPIGWGTMGGARSTAAAGEIADGVQVAPAYTRAACEFVVGHVREGAARAGRDWRDVDIAMAPVWVCAPDGDAARRVARTQTAFYLPMLAPQLLELQGVDLARVAAIAAAWEAGDRGEAVRLTTPDLVDVVAIAGTPEECLARVEEHVPGTGVTHLVPMITDPFHTRIIAGELVEGVPGVRGQLDLLGDTILGRLSALELEPAA